MSIFPDDVFAQDPLAAAFEEKTIKLKEGERRTVSILFADLKGFTEMSEKLDSELVQNTVDKIMSVFTHVIKSHGGYIDKYSGDEVMALFGAKVVSEVDTERTIRAGLQMLENLNQFNHYMKTLKEYSAIERPLAIRIGINTGLVTTGKIGEGREGDFTVYGDAVNLAYDTADKYGDVYMLGSIVHNEEVVDDLKRAGTKIIDNLDEVPEQSPILFRAHGTVNKLWDEAKAREMNVIDATCPLVYEIHHEVKTLALDGRQIIVIGDHGHDEVVAIADQVEDVIIVANPDEAEKLRKIKRAGVVSQSTQSFENVRDIINILMTKVFDLHFVNSICYPTKRNHEQVKEMADNHDIMIIIGSFSSANSKRLTQLARKKSENSRITRFCVKC